MPTVVITGASRGIGLELAKLYLADGARVVLGNRSSSREIVDLGAEEFPLDVASEASVKVFADHLAGQSVDVLINNAGIMGPEPDRQSTSDMDYDGFAEVIATTTFGPLRMTQALWPNLRHAEGKVAIITSRMGSLSNAVNPDRIAYRASKAAINKMAQCLAIDMAKDGVTVASIHPGWARTEMGGPDGEITPVESATGIKALVNGLNLGVTGRLWHYDGTALDW